MNDTTPTGPAGRRSALVVRGGWEGHEPVQTTDLFIPFLEEHGFDVRVEGSPDVYADTRALAETDLILQSISLGPGAEPVVLTDAAVAGLRSAVESGTGFAGWHGGVTASFHSNPYMQLIGGLFIDHPGKHPSERVGGPTDVFVPHTIDPTELGRTHPITAGIESFELTTEQYWVLHDDYIDVLATTTQAARPWDPWHRPVTSPAVWTRQWGAGRVFVSTPGHWADVFDHPAVRTITERGLLWASRGADAA